MDTVILTPNLVINGQLVCHDTTYIGYSWIENWLACWDKDREVDLFYYSFWNDRWDQSETAYQASRTLSFVTLTGRIFLTNNLVALPQGNEGHQCHSLPFSNLISGQIISDGRLFIVVVSHRKWFRLFLDPSADRQLICQNSSWRTGGTEGQILDAVMCPLMMRFGSFYQINYNEVKSDPFGLPTILSVEQKNLFLTSYYGFPPVRLRTRIKVPRVLGVRRVNDYTWKVFLSRRTTLHLEVAHVVEKNVMTIEQKAPEWFDELYPLITELSRVTIRSLIMSNIDMPLELLYLILGYLI